MLELLIALFLIGLCALPLAHVPMQALQEEMKSAYRMQMHRLGDLAFAEFKEKIYKQQIPWTVLSCSIKDKQKIMNGEVVYLSLPSMGKKTFKRYGTVHSYGKKTDQEQEWRLVTFCVEFIPFPQKSQLHPKKNKENFICTYQLLVGKTPYKPPAPIEQNLQPPAIETG